MNSTEKLNQLFNFYQALLRNVAVEVKVYDQNPRSLTHSVKDFKAKAVDSLIHDVKDEITSWDRDNTTIVQYYWRKLKELDKMAQGIFEDNQLAPDFLKAEYEIVSAMTLPLFDFRIWLNEFIMRNHG